MSWSWLQLSGIAVLSPLARPVWGVPAAVVVCCLAALAVVAMRARRRRRRRALRAALARGETQALKEQLRFRLAEPLSLFADAARSGPIIGVNEAFEKDLEAAAGSVLIEAAGHRAKAKELLRVRLNGQAGAGGRTDLNGSGATYWRQLGALCLVDEASEANAAYARAADLAPDDPQVQMLAGVLHLRAGKLAAAEAAFRRQIAASATESAQLWRYRGHTMLGDVHAARNAHTEALAAYAEAQREAQAMVERAPERSELRRDLSVTFDRMGDALSRQGALDEALANYRQALEIVEVLAKRDPHNAVWLRDQSISHDRIGDILDRKGDFEAALQSFQRGLEFAQRLALRDPGNTQWQWDLSASHDRIGDMQIAKGKTVTALKSYRRSLAIAEKLVAGDPGNIGWRRDLAVSYHKAGSLEADLNNHGEARDLLEKGRAIIARLELIASYQSQWRADLAKFDQALQALPV